LMSRWRLGSCAPLLKIRIQTIMQAQSDHCLTIGERSS
jgi:hypothetical protein